MNECSHRWTDHGGGDTVVCGRCGAKGRVVVTPTPPTHLERAREDYDSALLLVLGRGNSQYLGRLEGAIGHIICYLEGKEGAL
jgi:hypothetical protein